MPTAGQVAARWELIRAARLDELRMPARDWVRPAECVPVPVPDFVPVPDLGLGPDLVLAPVLGPGPRLAAVEPVPAADLADRPVPVTRSVPWPAEQSPAVPVPRTAEPAAEAARLPACADARRPVDRPVEPREVRTRRLGLARAPLALRRARVAAARERPPRPVAALDGPISTGPVHDRRVRGGPVSGGPQPRPSARIRPGELAVHRTSARQPD
ncbi:hypothetical protein ACFOWE_32010 [Planomonospora corallina]|uniref:Uncharacterized protein n=1 Tax=Planomonospora corallina TaxID=1806052 RepID=A0ABV8IFN2_9ACTN